MLVLIALALITFLALAVLSFIRSEDRSSQAVADISSMRTLQTLPEKLVISQIRRATQGLGNGAGFTWTSQPGLIRVFGTQTRVDGGVEVPVEEEFFKLYSADRMTMAGGSSPDELNNDLGPEESANYGAVWTDLNEPVVVSAKRSQNTGRVPSDDQLIYPILDPRAPMVDGFELTKPGSTETVRTAPMAVRWLYVLADGRLVAPQSEGKVINLDGATEQNPPVGRIAFWTDDESCKLNVNTASEPAPWMRPVTTSLADLSYSKSIPAAGEHYRESAHPAFTSLAPVLKYFGQPFFSNQAIPAKRESRDPTDSVGDSWWNMVKGVHQMGSLSPNWALSSRAGTEGGREPPEEEVMAKHARWFVSNDEFFFGLPRSNEKERPSNVPEATSRADVFAKMTQEDINWSRFFLTAHSRAPETNPFGWPKVSLWPVMEDASKRHELDRKMCLATSTIGASETSERFPYYFQRASEWISSAVPGASQSAVEDMEVTRNVELFEYLRDLASRPIPSAGGSFEDKYGLTSLNQQLVSMFDMIRWGVNPISPYDQALREPLSTEYSYLAPSKGRSDNPLGVDAYSAVPMRVDVPDGEGESVLADETAGTRMWIARGYGRFPTLTEVAVVIVASKVEMNGAQPKSTDGVWADETTHVRAFVVVEPYVVSPGTTPIAPSYRLRMTGLDQLLLTPKYPTGDPPVSLDFPTDGGLLTNPLVQRISTSMEQAGLSGGHSPFPAMAAQFLTDSGAPRILPPVGGPIDEELHYVFSSKNDVKLPVPSGSTPIIAREFDLTAGAPIVVSIYDGNSNISDPSALIQRIELNLQPVVVSVPRLKMTDKDTVILPTQPDELFKARFTPVLDPTNVRRVPFLRRGDVVVSMEAKMAPNSGGEGDIRLLAAMSQIPAKDHNTNMDLPNDIDPVAGYFRTIPHVAPPPGGEPDAGFQVHTLRDGAYMLEGQPGLVPATPPAVVDAPRPTFETAGGLVGRYPSYPPPANTNPNMLAYGSKALPGTAPGAVAMNFDDRPGDFDNGPGIIEDGPYINMPEVGTGTTEKEAWSALSTAGGYFQRGGEFLEDNGITYSPLRQMPSAVGFGSLPSAVYGIQGVGGSRTAADMQPRPWQTLLFCPNPPARTTPSNEEPGYDLTGAASAKRDHFGFKSPRDHWWLDFFWMPPVEPAGVCDSYSTEGKVNMNYQMIPFTHIKRATAMHGALAGVRMTIIPSASVLEAAGAAHYKALSTGTGTSMDFTYAVDATNTLKQFETRFETKRAFVSPSEICDIWLVPQRLPSRSYGAAKVPNTQIADQLSWWEGNAGDPVDAMEATGDNSREAPYGQLYPRLCTRSNVFKVHYRVQALQKVSSTKANGWEEAKDRVASEYRGEAVIERYIDPKRTGIPDFATTPDSDRALDDFYDYRVLGRKQFAP